MKFSANVEITVFVVWISKYRSSRSQMYFRTGVLKNFANIYREATVLESLFNEYVLLKACNFIKKRLQHGCFPVKFAKVLRTSGGYFWKYLMNSLFIPFENDEWCHFVVRIGSPALTRFYYVCFVFFYFFLFFLFFSGFFYFLVLR